MMDIHTDEFQSLIGRLRTERKARWEAAQEWFQSLIGRLRTLLQSGKGT